MIEDVYGCDEQELQAQLAYLESTPVRGIADLLRNGRCTLKKGIVRSLHCLGNLKTEFGQIGPLTPSATEGEEKFRVSEVVPTLRANRHVNDGGLLRAIEVFIEKDSLGEVEYNVTIFDFGNTFIIKDGNKKTIAFYERRKEAGDDVIEYPVFIASWTMHRANPSIERILSGLRPPRSAPLSSLFAIVSPLGRQRSLRPWEETEPVNATVDHGDIRMCIQVAQPEKLAPDLHLGTVSTCPWVRPLHRGAPYHRAQRSEGVCMRLLFCIAEASTTEEPGAEKLHARVCTGGRRLTGVLPWRRQY